jgi:hypothetical protein
MMESFECKYGYLKDDTLFDREPMKLLECWSDVMVTFDKRHNDSCKRILYALKTLKSAVRNAIKKRITIVQTRYNQRVCKNDSRVGIKKRANLA